MSGLRIAVGAPFEDGGLPGINPDAANDSVFSSGAAYVFDFGFSGWQQFAYVKASNPGPFDRFGTRLDLAGDRLAVAAAGEASSATGINGDQTINSAASAGAVYTFVRAVSGLWTQEAYVKAADSEANTFFGSDVALSDAWLAVGSSAENSGGFGVNPSSTSQVSLDSGAAYVFHAGDDPFANFCGANPNSTGAIGELSMGGSASLAANDLVLMAQALPTTSFGFFLVSREQGFVALPGNSVGNLCLAGAIGRYVGAGEIQNSGQSGTYTLAIDSSNIPQPLGFESALPYESWYFQAWHRDSVAGMPVSNFTNGLVVQFQP